MQHYKRPKISCYNLGEDWGNAANRTTSQKQRCLSTISKQLENLKDISNIVAFTDGSALGNPGPTGAGAVIYHNGMSSIPTKLASGVSKLSNNVHGEIFAIKLACSNIAMIVKKRPTQISQHF